jgi:uncharacterized protein YfaQ (DUF2300 family)
MTDSTQALQNAKYKNILQPTSESTNAESSYTSIDNLLEKEKISNKSETWTKLDKTVKTQKLHIFAEKYGKDHTIPVKDVKSLKQFFTDCLDKNKLQKTKDVTYDKDKGTITSIPALHFNITNRAFTLKNLDTKRVSTIKSLTPRRTTEKSHIEEETPINM